MGGTKRSVESTALLVTVFCLLVYLQLTEQGDIGIGEKCDSVPGFCKPGLLCEGRQDRCVIRSGWDCSNHRDMCSRGNTCDASNRCKTKVKGYCYGSYACGVGATCKDNKCKCTAKFHSKGGVCVPNSGVTGTNCTKHKECTDPLGRCNKEDGVCECRPPTVVSSRDFSCKYPEGYNCTSSGDCKPGTVCDSDKICKLLPGSGCEGKKANLCLLEDVCREGICRNRIGTSCNIYFSTSICEPPSTCWTNHICSYKMQQNCSKHPDFCEGDDTACDTVTELCKRKIGVNSCWTTDQCPYSSTCVDYKCRCQPDGKGVWNETLKICEIPVGMVGGPCREGENVNECDESTAKCKDGKCQCRLGHVVEPNHLTCSMRWWGCSLTGQGKISTFSKEAIQVRLPCTFKLANIKCGKVKAMVYAQNSYQPQIHNNLITAIDVTIITNSTDDGKITRTYRITRAKISELQSQNQTEASGNAWETVSSDAESPDSDVTLTTDISSGVSVLQRRLLKITYTPPVVSRSDTGQYTVQNWGQVLTQCAHPNFDGAQQYPYALCGKLVDEGLRKYKSRVERELKKDLPDTYSQILSEATSSARLTDRAILIEQKRVVQSNPLCKEASDLVAPKECPALQENLYNCSIMYDANRPNSYPACVDTAIQDPMKLFISCVRTQCDRVEGGRNGVTCQTLQTAAGQCPDKTEVSDLLTMANCNTTEA